jgi:beta propeller domain-containing protein
MGSIRGVLGSAAAALLACGGEAAAPPVATTGDDLETDGATDAPTEPGLVSGQSCDALLDALRAELIERVQARAELARQSPGSYLGDYELGAPFAAQVLSGFTAPSAQVPGVGEGDFVQAEGDRLYILNDSVLYVVNAWPAEAMQVLARVPIESGAMELMVHDGKVVVFSRVLGALPGTDDSLYPGYDPVFAKLTVVDANATPPAVVRELYVEGEYAFSRKHGSVVRAVVQQVYKVHLDAPVVSAEDVYGRRRTQEQIDRLVDGWAAGTALSIEDSVLDDYVPTIYERQAGALVKQSLPCEDYLLPSSNPTELGATTVVALDLDGDLGAGDGSGIGANTAPVGNLTLLGRIGSFFFGEGSAVLTQVDRISNRSEPTHGESRLHLFQLDGTGARYVASGFVPGFVPSLDEQSGVIRAHMTQEIWSAVEDAGLRYQGNFSRVVTLGPDHSRQGQLTELGRTPDIITDSLTARFVGDRAYLLTSTLPAAELVVVDLSVPSAPRFSGRLPSHGDTDALVPLPGDQLLAVTQEDDPGDAYTRHATLQLFDVSDAAAPSLLAQHAYPPSSSGSSDARGITVDAEHGLFALPITQLDGNYDTLLETFQLSAGVGFSRLGGISTKPAAWSLLECLGLGGYPTDPDSVAQLEQDPARVAAIMEECSTRPTWGDVQRGSFRGGNVFAIGYTRVHAYSLDALSGPPLGQVALPRSL